jgi:serine/threonine protein kinase
MSEHSGLPKMTFSEFLKSTADPQLLEYGEFRHIGRGSHADVFRCRNLATGEYFAAKVYDKVQLGASGIGCVENLMDRVMCEVRVLSRISSEYSVRLIEALDDEMTDSVVLIETLAPGGCLLPDRPTTPVICEPDAQIFFTQIALCLQHLHGQGIVHRDIKPNNVLRMSTMRVVLSDYSVSAVLDDGVEYVTDTKGTPMYFAPEGFSGQPYRPKPADIWALGVSLYVMVFGRVPFSKEAKTKYFLTTFLKLAQLVTTCEITYLGGVSLELIDLLRHLLDKNVRSRFTIEQVLEHEWVKKGVWRLQNLDPGEDKPIPISE